MNHQTNFKKGTQKKEFKFGEFKRKTERMKKIMVRRQDRMEGRKETGEETKMRIIKEEK